MLAGPFKSSLSPALYRTNVRWILLAAALVSLVVGAIALAGWIAGLPRLTRLGLPGDDPVKATTAVGFILAAAALFCSLRERFSWSTAHPIRMVLGVLILLLGAAALGDRLVFLPDTLRSAAAPSPFRMSLNTALALSLLGISFLSPPSGEHGVWRLGSITPVTDLFSRSGPLLVGWKWWFAQACATAAATIGYVAIIGHIYSADLLYGFSPDVNMALPSAICVFLLGTASFFREPDAAFAAEVTSSLPGGIVLRWVVTSAAIVMPCIGWLRLLAQDSQVLDYRLGAALFAATSVVLLAAGLWISARHLNHAAGLQRFAQIELSMQADLLEDRVRRRTMELHTSEAHFRLLTDTSPALIWMTDPHMNFEFISSVGSTFFGTSDAALGKRWLERVHPQDIPTVRSILAHAAKSATGFEFQMRLRRADGDYRWMHSQGLPRTGPDGQLTGFIGASLDVTDPHLAREALREALANREEALAREQSLRRELDHRVRNNLAGLLGLVAFYATAARESPAAAAITSTLQGKIRAMKDVHDVIAKAGGSSVELADLVRRLLTAMVPDERRSSLHFLDSIRIRISSQQASALAIIIQELTTNSFKHGALSDPDGTITIDWQADQTVPRIIHFTWDERFASTRARTPASDGGVGLALIKGFAQSDLRGQCTFSAEEGRWKCSLIAHLEAVRSASIPHPGLPQ